MATSIITLRIFLLLSVYGANYSCTKNESPKTAIVKDNSNTALGNPSKASSSNPDNYLIDRKQYCLSYNNTNHIPNWASWHLDSTDIGEASRSNKFFKDTTLHEGWYEVTNTDYKNSGFDKGHLCPSADRTSTEENNDATFFLSNIIPQAPKNNEIVWESLEEYCRSLVKSGNELYIICGVYGKGGIGSKGYAETLKNDILVPAKTWKIIIVLPYGTNDLKRINTNTRVISVIIPNTQDCAEHFWDYYRVNVDSIESLTGFDFLSNVSISIQQTIEQKIDTVTIK